MVEAKCYKYSSWKVELLLQVLVLYGFPLDIYNEWPVSEMHNKTE